MARLTIEAQLDPIVRTFATFLYPGNEDRRQFGSNVRRWVRRKVAYFGEPFETLTPPDLMLHGIADGHRMHGDCDDMSMLAGALLTAAGVPVRFTAVKLEGEDEYQHVFPEMFDEGEWLMVDPLSRQIPPGTWEVMRVDV